MVSSFGTHNATSESLILSQFLSEQALLAHSGKKTEDPINKFIGLISVNWPTELIFVMRSFYRILVKHFIIFNLLN